uniref:Zinc finger matrin-type 2 n=1 Tax=Cercocebus atys TaxID=9531 RepID=A0A2K5LYA4_CERAT
MASGSGTKNLDFRRKWDKDEYEKLAEKRLTEEREKKDGKPVQPVKRELLRHRDYKVDLESKLGKTIVITKTTPQSEMGEEKAKAYKKEKQKEKKRRAEEDLTFEEDDEMAAVMGFSGFGSTKKSY